EIEAGTGGSQRELDARLRCSSGAIRAGLPHRPDGRTRAAEAAAGLPASALGKESPGLGSRRSRLGRRPLAARPAAEQAEALAATSAHYGVNTWANASWSSEIGRAHV